MSSQLDAKDSRVLVWADDEKVSNSISAPMSLNDGSLHSCVKLGSAHRGSSNHCAVGAVCTSCISGVETQCDGRRRFEEKRVSAKWKIENSKSQIQKIHALVHK